MLRGFVKVFLYVVAALFGIVFIATLVLWLLVELIGAPLPALEPFSELMDVVITGLLALASYLGSRRISSPKATSLPWNWWWYRYWYLRDLLRDPRITAWETDFAPLQLREGREEVALVDVLVEGTRRGLIDTLKDAICKNLNGNNRVLVLGEPGSGKTTGLIRLTWELAKDGAHLWATNKPIPVLMRLGDFQEGTLLSYARESMRNSTKGRSGRVLSFGFDRLLDDQRVVLLFDALDEALGNRREIVLAQLSRFLGRRDINVPVVITARTREDPGQRL